MSARVPTRPAPPARRATLASMLLRAAARHPGGLALMGSLMVLEALALAASPWPMKLLVDHFLIAPGASPDDLPDPVGRVLSVLGAGESAKAAIAWLVAAFILIFTVLAVIGLAQATVSAAVGQRMVYTTAAEVFAKLQRLSLLFHARSSVGDSMRRITGDCTAIATMIRDAILPAAAALISMLVMFAIMLRLNLNLALVAGAVAPLLLVSLRRLTPPVLERGYHYAQAEAGVWTVAERSLRAVPVIQAFRAEARTEALIRARYDEVLASAAALTWSQFRLKIVTGAVLAIATAALLVIGAREVLAQRLTVGGLLVFMAYLAALYAPMTATVHAISSAGQSVGGVRRVLNLLGEEEDVRDAPGAAPIDLASAPAIEFQSITFAYEPKRPVLRSLNLSVSPGQTVAIVGESGSGKSTLAALLARLLDPQEGRVLIDGHDVRSVTLRSLREQVAILLQDTYLFPVSIAENIAYARPNATPEQVRAAASAAGAHEFISALPEGYATMVGQRGATLSGGERQRIAIARALLKDAPILILDEPTSALDSLSEAGLLEALQRLAKGRTTFIIAHRLSTVRIADRIVVLQDGHIAESGTHRELLALGGAYAKLYHLQQHSAAPAARPTEHRHA